MWTSLFLQIWQLHHRCISFSLVGVLTSEYEFLFCTFFSVISNRYKVVCNIPRISGIGRLARTAYSFQREFTHFIGNCSIFFYKITIQAHWYVWMHLQKDNSLTWVHRENQHRFVTVSNNEQVSLKKKKKKKKKSERIMRIHFWCHLWVLGSVIYLGHFSGVSEFEGRNHGREYENRNWCAEGEPLIGKKWSRMLLVHEGAHLWTREFT